MLRGRSPKRQYSQAVPLKKLVLFPCTQRTWMYNLTLVPISTNLPEPDEQSIKNVVRAQPEVAKRQYSLWYTPSPTINPITATSFKSGSRMGVKNDSRILCYIRKESRMDANLDPEWTPTWIQNGDKSGISTYIRSLEQMVQPGRGFFGFSLTVSSVLSSG